MYTSRHYLITVGEQCEQRQDARIEAGARSPLMFDRSGGNLSSFERVSAHMLRLVSVYTSLEAQAFMALSNVTALMR